MEDDGQFAAYMESRRRLYTRLDEIRLEVNALIETFKDELPTLEAVMQLEALHSERARLVHEGLEVEQQFVNYLIERRRPRAAP